MELLSYPIPGPSTAFFHVEKKKKICSSQKCWSLEEPRCCCARGPGFTEVEIAFTAAESRPVEIEVLKALVRSGGSDMS